MNEEYWKTQGSKPRDFSPVVVDDVLAYAVEQGITELKVTPVQMLDIISFGMANFQRLPGEWWEVVERGWLDKFMGIRFYNR